MKRDTVFKKLFKVIVPRIATYSEEELQYVGVRIDGRFNNEGFIESDSNKPNLVADTRVMLSLDKIINIYADGYPIKVPSGTDIVKIGEILDNYINNNFSDTSIHFRGTVDERLETIKMFMQEILGLHLGKFEKKANEQLRAFDIQGITLMNTDNGEFNSHRPTIKLSTSESGLEDYRPSYKIQGE